MKLAARFCPHHALLRPALACVSAAFLLGCQTQPIILSPPLHTRIVDGVTGKPLARVRVTLLSRDAPASTTAYSDWRGIVDMPGLAGRENIAFRFLNDAPPASVHALFERPGYAPYMIDAVNGYGFFKGYHDVRLFRD
jgi:hypothetical protein